MKINRFLAMAASFVVSAASLTAAHRSSMMICSALRR